MKREKKRTKTKKIEKSNKGAVSVVGFYVLVAPE